MTPDVTVVVPAYNPGTYLHGCLESLAAQSIGADRLQVVVVDDGSTDGSAELLDRFAAERDGFEVVHQENSGGPARPCNVGLARARGRYVFFLGSDDQLGSEALERMVAAADRWGSDVVCGKVVGTNGRVVLQDLFRETVEDVPFPSRDLAHALANIKLFRREMLVEHGIDYPLELRIGSDQPFTIQAMRHARRISVLADYDYYVAVRRDDASNVSYATGWRTRLACIAAVMDWVAAEVPPGAERDIILHRHFNSELAKLLRRDHAELDAAEQDELVDGIKRLVDDYLTPAISDQLRVIARVRYQLVSARRHDDLRVLIGAEDRSWPLLLTEPVSRGLPGHGTDPDAWFVVREEPLRGLISKALAPATVRVVGRELVVEADCDLRPGGAADVRLMLAHAPTSESRPARRVGPDFHPRMPTSSVEIRDRRLSARIGLDVLRDAERVPFALRLLVDLPGGRFTVPLRLAEAREDDVPGTGEDVVVRVRPDAHGRALVEVPS